MRYRNPHELPEGRWQAQPNLRKCDQIHPAHHCYPEEDGRPHHQFIHGRTNKIWKDLPQIATKT